MTVNVPIPLWARYTNLQGNFSLLNSSTCTSVFNLMSQRTHSPLHYISLNSENNGNFS